MTNHAIEILQDDLILQQFKANAAAHAKKFDIHAIVPKYEALYDRFLRMSSNTKPMVTA
jgi:hypothetical protein